MSNSSATLAKYCLVEGVQQVFGNIVDFSIQRKVLAIVCCIIVDSKHIEKRIAIHCPAMNIKTKEMRNKKCEFQKKRHHTHTNF